MASQSPIKYFPFIMVPLVWCLSTPQKYSSEENTEFPEREEASPTEIEIEEIGWGETGSQSVNYTSRRQWSKWSLVRTQRRTAEEGQAEGPNLAGWVSRAMVFWGAGQSLHSALWFIKNGFGLLIAGKSLILLVKCGWLSPWNRTDTSQGMRVLVTDI